jgi:polysaccharide export outer membrane protein
MKMRKFLITVAVGVLLISPQHSWSQTPARTLEPGVSSPPDTDYTAGPQDVLEVTVFGESDVSGKFQVEADGTLNFPLIGRVRAAGLTLRAIERELHKRLSDGFLQNPQVSVSVGSFRSQRIFVVGEVMKPGPYPLTE